MGFALEDRTQLFDVKLVQKNTFLHLEPQDGAAGDCSPPQLCFRRSVTDSVVDYTFAVESEATGSRRPLVTCCDTREQLPTLNHEDHSCSSLTTDTDDEEPVQLALPSTARQCCEAVREAMLRGDAAREEAQTRSCKSAPREQLYYYFPLPGSALFGLGAGTGPCNMHFFPNGCCMVASAHTHLCGSAVLPPPAETCSSPQPSAAAATAQKQGRKPGFESQVALLQQEEFTTLMLRNIPNDYTRSMILELLDSNGFDNKYDFVYLPVDFSRMAGLGYVFVNFVSHADAELAKLCLQGFNQWKIQSQKTCEVCWGHPLQGLEAHIARYRSSPVMHADIPDEFKPIVFRAGLRVAFPPPIRRVRAPRSKQGGSVEEDSRLTAFHSLRTLEASPNARLR